MSRVPAAILLSLSPAIALYARADVYMTDAAAVESIFPKQKMTKGSLTLTDDDVAAIEKASGLTVRSRTLNFFKNDKKDILFTDEVLGKHEMIYYAVGVDQTGKVAGIEVLEYRESYGQGVRKPDWKDQFKGKDLASHFKIGDDVRSLSGATLSSLHLTNGIKRLLVTYARISDRL